MSCRMCGSQDEAPFYSEINIHFPGLKNLTRTVWAFPALLVCMSCGFTELQIEEGALRQLHDGIESRKAAA